MNHATNFRSARDGVSAQEWRVRVELAACHRLIDAYGMTDLTYNHVTARIPGKDHILINLAFNTLYQLELACRTQVDAMAARTDLVIPETSVLEKTAHLYQPQTRRPYGVLELPAMLRLLDAEQKNSAYPPYYL